MFYDETKGMVYKPQTINTVEKDGVRRGFFGYDYRDLKIDPNWEPDIEKAVSIPLKPGEAVMFWSTLMHASYPHLGKAKDMRLAFVGRYVPTSVRVYPDADVVEEYGGKIDLACFGVVVVSGRDEYGHNRVITQTTRGFQFPTLP